VFAEPQVVWRPRRKEICDKGDVAFDSRLAPTVERASAFTPQSGGLCEAQRRPYLLQYLPTRTEMFDVWSPSERNTSRR